MADLEKYLAGKKKYAFAICMASAASMALTAAPRAHAQQLPAGLRDIFKTASADQETPEQDPAAPAKADPNKENTYEPAPEFDKNGINVYGGNTAELHVTDMPLSEVLQILSLEGKRNIITSPNVTGAVTANLYDVTFEEALEAILTPHNAGFRTIGDFVYIYTNEELEKLEQSDEKKLLTRVFRLSYINATDANAYVLPLLGDGETVTAAPTPAQGLDNDASDGGNQSDASNDVIVVTASPAKIRMIEAMLNDVDIRPRQVLIEATILRAQLDDENALGVDFTLVSGVDLELLGGVSNGIEDLTLGQLPQERFELFNAIATTDFRDQVPSGGLTFGVIKDNVAIFLRALEQVTDTTVIANPKVLALNKQKGQVIVGRRDGYLTTTVTETQTVQTVEFLVTGTQLIFRPFIGDDGYVRMELHPEDSVGFVSAQGLPSEQTTEVTTNVIVRDGQTILIGGLFREVTTRTNQQLPILGNLPVVGPLFRAQNDGTAREEVIILLTVKIVDEDESYAEDSFDVLDRIDRIRVGARRGLMWTGRERLAQKHYQNALESVSIGDNEKALWHTDIALRNYPQMVAADRLREDLLQKRDWDEDGSAARSFIFNVIRQEKGYPNELFGQPLPKTVPKIIGPGKDLQGRNITGSMPDSNGIRE